MLFSSLTFLFYFLPAVLLVYYLTPKPGRNAVLLLASVLFYSWGGLGFTALLLSSITLNFFFAKQIGRTESTARTWLIAGIVVNAALLIYYKYMNFFLENFNLAIVHFTGEPPTEFTKIVLPLGISFYTFHQMSMLRDIYRDRSLPKVTYLNTALYVTFFPQLVAGPIVRYKDIIYQIRERNSTTARMYDGTQRFIIGLFKKVVIANTCALLADRILGTDASLLSPGATWLGVLAYTLQIYFDFSGYSDMAIGLAKLFGFDLLENFNLPYVARSIKDFWRRWHISLSTWFRDYVYIPLGGSKRGEGRMYVNLLIVFTLTGFWHGASWSFIFWGLFHGFFLVMERLWLGRLLEKIPAPFSWAYTMLVVMTGWLFFRVEDFGTAWNYLLRMWDFSAVYMKDALYFLDNELLVTLGAGIFFSMVPFKKLTERLQSDHVLAAFPLEFVRTAVYLCMFVYSVAALTSSTYNPFIYFNF
jgi:alginate O-acetyltransferase complex protein AlgI